MDRRVAPPKRVTSPAWGTSPPCKHALSWELASAIALASPLSGDYGGFQLSNRRFCLILSRASFRLLERGQRRKGGNA